VVVVEVVVVVRLLGNRKATLPLETHSNNSQRFFVAGGITEPLIPKLALPKHVEKQTVLVEVLL